MPFVTTITLRSGDRVLLDAVAGEIQEVAERKGVELKGPHANPPTSYRVPLYRRLDGSGGEYPVWEYTVYERVLRLGGHDETVRQVAGRNFPRGIHVEVEVTRVRSIGSR